MKRVILFALLVGSCIKSEAQSKNFIDQPFIEVTGMADTLLVPDEIFIRILLSEKDTRDRTSLEELEQQMIKAIKEIGIDIEKNLTASDMSSNYKNYLFKNRDIIKNRKYILKVGNAVTAERVFIQLEQIGISNTAIDHVSHSGTEAFRNLMRTKAVQMSRSKALALVNTLGQSLGQAIYIGEVDINAGMPVYSGNNLNEVVVVGYYNRKSADIELPKVEFEKIRVFSTVNIKFILKE